MDLHSNDRSGFYRRRGLARLSLILGLILVASALIAPATGALSDVCSGVFETPSADGTNISCSSGPDCEGTCSATTIVPPPGSNTTITFCECSDGSTSTCCSVTVVSVGGSDPKPRAFGACGGDQCDPGQCGLTYYHTGEKRYAAAKCYGF